MAQAQQGSRRRALRSLRSRIVAMAVVGTVLLAGVALVLLVHRDWRLADTVLLDRVLDETDRYDRATAQQFDEGRALEIEAPTAGDTVAIFDASGALSQSIGPADDIAAIADEFAIDELDELDLLADEVELDGDRWAVGVAGCIEPQACSGIIVARRYVSFSSYLVDRLAWIVALVALAAVMVALAARWVVGVSLRPVERMRQELAEITAADLARRVQVPASGDELEALAVSFNDTIDRLERGVVAQRNFTSDAAHELRSPLTGVRAVLEVGQLHPEQAAASVTTAIAQIDRAGRLVDDMLVLARRDGTRSPMARRATDLDDLASTALRDAAARYPAVTFDRRWVTPVQSVVASAHISRVLQNLLDNGATHARGTVRISLRAEPQDWVLSVDDDGPGVPQHERERIFERFARLDESRSRNTGGTGLGLAIVRELVAEHAGTVTVTDSDLGGASFVVRVPLSTVSP